jgi:hypothetical protein
LLWHKLELTQVIKDDIDYFFVIKFISISDLLLNEFDCLWREVILKLVALEDCGLDFEERTFVLLDKLCVLEHEQLIFVGLYEGV